MGGQGRMSKDPGQDNEVCQPAGRAPEQAAAQEGPGQDRPSDEALSAATAIDAFALGFGTLCQQFNQMGSQLEFLAEFATAVRAEHADATSPSKGASLIMAAAHGVWDRMKFPDLSVTDAAMVHGYGVGTDQGNAFEMAWAWTHGQLKKEGADGVQR